jgi:hypothetical protein
LLAFAWIFSQWKSMMEELIFQTFTLHYDWLLDFGCWIRIPYIHYIVSLIPIQSNPSHSIHSQECLKTCQNQAGQIVLIIDFAFLHRNSLRKRFREERIWSAFNSAISVT